MNCEGTFEYWTPSDVPDLPEPSDLPDLPDRPGLPGLLGLRGDAEGEAIAGVARAALRGHFDDVFASGEAGERKVDGEIALGGGRRDCQIADRLSAAAEQLCRDLGRRA